MKKEQILSNGLTVITDINYRVSTATYAVYFAVGSMYESEEFQGITHLVEHMFFRRLNKLCQKELYFKSESLGGTINGLTSQQYVCFDLTVISDYADEALELMREFFSDFEWTNKEIEAEKKVVLKEIEMNGSSFNYLSYYQTGSECYANPIKGSEESIKSISCDEINRWKKSYFNCNNACFVVTGNISNKTADAIIDKLSEYNSGCDKIKRKRLHPKKAFKRTDKDRLFPNIDGDIADISIFFDVDLKKVDWVSLQTVYDAFCCGNGSKLSFMLRDTGALTYAIESELLLFDGYARVETAWSVNCTDLFESLDIFSACLDDFKNGITDEELISSVKFSTANAVKFRDNTQSLASQYGYFDFICNQPFDIEKSVAYEISKDKINTAINDIFADENMYVYVAANRKHIRKKDLVKFFNRSNEVD